jgi:cell cycle sensor histidine kinase DivJ
VNVNEVVESTLRSLDPRVRANFSLQSNTNPALWPVIAEVRALDHVLVSLVMSAVSANEPGDNILIETANLEAGEAAELSQGLLAERCVRISVRDFRGWLAAYNDSCVSGPLAGETRRHGTTVGLPISRQIVEQHAGVLWITSRPGWGTKAIVLLPACLPQQSWGCPTSEAHGKLLR